jgi:hypothetical protein
MPDRVFIFDAWAHDRDPLRRVFLENLIAFLSDRIDKHRWAKRTLELRGRRKVTESRVTPHLTGLGAAFGLFTLFLPVGAAVLAAGLNATKPDALLRNVGLLACLAPAGLLIAVSLINGAMFLWRKHWEKDADAKYRFVGLFLNRATHDERTESQEDPEPTSLEFAEMFTALLQESASGRTEPLVLVVDNLDRVERDRALGVWSALRVFIEECNRGNEWSKKTWLLVPYDRPALENLWVRTQLEDGFRDSQADERSDRPGDAADLQAHTVSESFLQKTFAVRFNVPPLLLADWREYLIALLKTAFPAQEESEFHSVYRVVAVWRDEVGAPPTPRHLKLLVNDMSALYRQWPAAFPLADLAYFAVLRTQGKDVSRGLLSQEIPGDRFRLIVSEEIVEHFAALHFNRDIEQARHLLLEGPMKEAMRRGDGSELRRLSEIRGFWPVFEDIAPRLAEDFSDLESVSNAGFALLSSGLSDDASPDQYKPAVGEFCRASTTDVDWSSLNEKIAQGIAAHMEILGSQAQTRRLLHGVLRTVKSLGVEEGATEAPMRTTLEGVLVLLEKVAALGHDGALDVPVVLPSNTDALIEACSFLGEQRTRTKRFWKHLACEADAAEVIERISPKQGEEQWSEEHARTFDVLLAIGFRARWSDFVDNSIAAMSVTDDSLPSGTIVAITSRLHRLAQVHRKKLQDFAQGGFLHHHYHRAVARALSAEAAGIFSSIIRVRNPLAAPGNVGESQAGHQHIQQLIASPPGQDEFTSQVFESFCEQVTPQNCSSLLGELLDAGQNAFQFVQALIDQLAGSGRLTQVLSAGFLIKNWRLFEQALADSDGLGLGGLIERFAEDPSFISEVCKQDFAQENAALLRSVVQASGLDQADFREWVKTGLRSVTKKDWSQALTESSALIDLLIEVRRAQADFVLEDPLLDALAEYGVRLAAGEEGPGQYDQEDWGLVLKSISNSDRGVLSRRLLSDLRGAAIEGEGFFARFGEVLGDREALIEAPQRVYELFSPLVSDPSVDGVRWLGSVIGKDSTLLDNFPKETVEDFRGRVQAALESDEQDTDLCQAFERLAEAVGMEIPDRGDEPPPE